MKIVLPSEKYKNSYFDLLDSAKENNDYNELGNAALRNNETFNEMIIRLKNRRIGKKIAKKDVPATTFWIIDATRALGLIIKKYKKMYTKKILITCLEDNEASKKVILKNNGEFEKTVFDKVINQKISRYIITLRNEE